MKRFVKDTIEESMDGKPLAIGIVTTHPDTGREVKITDGQFYGTYGVSNWWEWEDIETGEKGSGYGWTVKERLDD